MRIYRKYIERITIIGPKAKRGEAFDYCSDNGFYIKWSGPKPIAKYRYDAKKFKIVAEREVKEDTN